VGTPLVSVVIPVFDQAAWLPEALAAVAAQTYEPVECIVVDDASTDDSAAVAEAHPHGRVIRLPENGGAPPARNAGIAAASGELLAMADADDVMLPGKVAAQVAFLAEHPEVGVVLARHELLVDPGAEGVAARRPRDPVFGDIGGVEPFGMLLRRSAFETAGPFDGDNRYSEGLEWLTRARRAGVTIAVHPEPLYRRRIHDTNLSSQRARLVTAATMTLRRRIAEQRAAQRSGAADQ
jgi:glycosyltransferase involved in cell wall biosynthesis